MCHSVVIHFTCLTFRLSTELSKSRIPWIIGLRSPWRELDEMAWTTKRESDSSITYVSIIWRAKSIPSSATKASVTSTPYVADSNLALAATTIPLTSTVSDHHPHTRGSTIFKSGPTNIYFIYPRRWRSPTNLRRLLPKEINSYRLFIVTLDLLCKIPDLSWWKALRLMNHLVSVVPDLSHG